MEDRLVEELFGKKKKKGINSRDKGVKNELVLARALEKWTGVPFARVPSSGGLRWKNDANTVGDLVCEDRDFNFLFAVETKHYKKVNLDISKPSQVLKAWEQASRDALRANKIPLVFYRINGMAAGTYIVYYSADLLDEFDVFYRFEASHIYEGKGLRGMESEKFFSIGYDYMVRWVTRA